jgi:hypothetical protein
MVFLREYRDVVMTADGSRGVNTGMAAPRSHAYHASQSPTGCINTTVALDTAADTAAILAVYSEGFDFVSIHYYGCRSGNAPYGWCNMSASGPMARGDVDIFHVSLCPNVSFLSCVSVLHLCPPDHDSITVLLPRSPRQWQTRLAKHCTLGSTEQPTKARTMGTTLQGAKAICTPWQPSVLLGRYSCLFLPFGLGSALRTRTPQIGACIQAILHIKTAPLSSLSS